MIELTGSEKQLNWAEQIKSDFVEQTEECLANLSLRALNGNRRAEADLERYKKAYNAILNSALEASWWIDTRSSQFRNLLDLVSGYQEDGQIDVIAVANSRIV